jgi:hypothetical protein
MSSQSFLKRLEQIGKVISVKRPRLIVITVPTDASTGLVSAETDAGVAELHREHGVTDTDLVVHIANYCDDVEQPQVVSITQQY